MLDIHKKRGIKWYFLLFWIALAVGVYIRLINLTHTGFFFDTITTQYVWAKNAVDMGFFGFWLHYKDFYDYPPVNLLFLYIIENIARFFGGGGVAFITVLKSVYLVADIVLLAAVYLFLQQNNIEKRRRFLILSILAIFPALWFVSGVWGQSDSLMATVIFLGLWQLGKNTQKSTVIAALLLGTLVFFKLQALLVVGGILLVWAIQNRNKLSELQSLILPYLASLIAIAVAVLSLATVHQSQPWGYTLTDFLNGSTSWYAFLFLFGVLLGTIASFLGAFQQNEWKNKLVFLGTLGCVVLCISSAFITINPLQYFRTVIESLLGSSGFRSAANLPQLIMKLVNDANLWSLIWLPQFLSLIVYVGFLIMWLRKSIRISHSSISYLLSTSSLFLIYFTFSSGRVHSRYAHIAIVLLIILIPFLKLRWYQWLAYCAVGVLYTTNQIAVYASTAENYISISWKWLLDTFPINNYIINTVLFILFSSITLFPLLSIKNVRQKYH